MSYPPLFSLYRLYERGNLFLCVLASMHQLSLISDHRRYLTVTRALSPAIVFLSMVEFLMVKEQLPLFQWVQIFIAFVYVARAQLISSLCAFTFSSSPLFFSFFPNENFMSPLLFSPRFALHALYANAENAAVVVSHLHSFFFLMGRQWKSFSLFS